MLHRAIDIQMVFFFKESKAQNMNNVFRNLGQIFMWSSNFMAALCFIISDFLLLLGSPGCSFWYPLSLLLSSAICCASLHVSVSMSQQIVLFSQHSSLRLLPSYTEVVKLTKHRASIVTSFSTGAHSRSESEFSDTLSFICKL